MSSLFSISPYFNSKHRNSKLNMAENAYETYFDYNILILARCGVYLKNFNWKTNLTKKIYSYIWIAFVPLIFVCTEFITVLLNKKNTGAFIQVLRDFLNHLGGTYKVYIWYKHRRSMLPVLTILTHDYNYETYREFQPESILMNHKNQTLKLYKLGLWFVNVLCVCMALVDLYVIFNPNEENDMKTFPDFGDSQSGQIAFLAYRRLGDAMSGWLVICKRNVK